MSNFELNDLGEGRFELVGEMSFDTADQILNSSELVFRQHKLISVNLSRVAKADSAGLALLLEWKAQANQRSGNIEFEELPQSLLAIARTTEVSDLIL